MKLNNDTILHSLDFLNDKDALLFLSLSKDLHNIYGYELKEYYDIKNISLIKKLKKFNLRYVKNICRSIQLYELPMTVTHVTFDDYFKEKLHYIPFHIISIKFGQCFNESLDDSFQPDMPNKITCISFGNLFNKSLNKLPDTISYLKFDFWFDKPIDNLPKNLRYLEVGDLFDYPVDNLPSTLDTLILGVEFNQPINHLPKNLKYLRLGVYFNYPIDDLPDSLQYLDFDYTHEPPQINKYPASLNTLKIFKFPTNTSKPIPQHVKVIDTSTW